MRAGVDLELAAGIEKLQLGDVTASPVVPWATAMRTPSYETAGAVRLSSERQGWLLATYSALSVSANGWGCHQHCLMCFCSVVD